MKDEIIHTPAFFDNTNQTSVSYGYDALRHKTNESILQTFDSTAAEFFSAKAPRRITVQAKHYRPSLTSESLDWERLRSELNDAFDYISMSNEQDVSPTEKSNQFDAWRLSLETVTHSSDLLSIQHRSILGALLSSSAQKDYCDVSQLDIKEFIDATNTLRKPTISRREADDTIKKLIKISEKLTMNLNAESMTESHIKMLDKLMIELIEKSKENTND